MAVFVNGKAAARTANSGGRDSSYRCSEGGSLPSESPAGRRLIAGVNGPVYFLIHLRKEKGWIHHAT